MHFRTLALGAFAGLMLTGSALAATDAMSSNNAMASGSMAAQTRPEGCKTTDSMHAGAMTGNAMQAGNTMAKDEHKTHCKTKHKSGQDPMNHMAPQNTGGMSH